MNVVRTPIPGTRHDLVYQSLGLHVTSTLISLKSFVKHVQRDVRYFTASARRDVEEPS